LWSEVATTLFIKVIERKTKTPIEGSKKTGNHKTITLLCGLEFIHTMNEPWVTFILLWPYLRLTTIFFPEAIRSRRVQTIQLKTGTRKDDYQC